MIEWADDGVVSQKSGSSEPAFVHEEQAVGILEFGFGFWSRFLWNNGDSVLAVKPQMLGVARLSEGKQAVATVFLVKGSYEFQTVSGSQMVSSRVKYD